MKDPPPDLPAEEPLQSDPSLPRASALMSVGTLLSRITGLVRLAAIAYVIGIAETRLTDSYNLANTIPNIIYEILLGGVLTSVFVPVFVGLLETEGREKAWHVMSGIINVSLTVLLGVTAAGMLAAPWIARFYASRLGGVEAQLQEQAITFMLRLFIPQIVFYALYFILTGVLNSHKRFGAPAFTPALNNVVVIAVFVAFHAAYGNVSLATVSNGQLAILALGTTAGVVAAAVALLPFLRGITRYRFVFSVAHPSMKKLLKLSAFMIALIATNQVGFLTVQWLANAEKGGFSAYQAAFTFFLLPQGLFGVSINTALLPSMSRHAANQRWDELRERISTGIRATLFLVAPVAAGYIVLSEPIVRLLLEHGVMEARSTALVAGVLRILAFALVPFSLFQFFLRGFYALQDTKTPMIVNALSVGIAIVINVSLFPIFKVQGLATGNAIAYTFASIAMGWALARRAGGFDKSRILSSAARIGAAAAAMGVIVWVVSSLVRGWIASPSVVHQAGALALTLAAGGLSYVGLSVVMKVEELSFVRALVRRSPAPSAGGEEPSSSL